MPPPQVVNLFPESCVDNTLRGAVWKIPRLAVSTFKRVRLIPMQALSALPRPPPDTTHPARWQHTALGLPRLQNHQPGPSAVHTPPRLGILQSQQKLTASTFERGPRPSVSQPVLHEPLFLLFLTEHSPEPAAGPPGPGPAGRRLGVLSSSRLQNGTKEQLLMRRDPQEGIPWGPHTRCPGAGLALLTGIIITVPGRPRTPSMPGIPGRPAGP